jgi:vancomycin resistance protein YoaR
MRSSLLSGPVTEVPWQNEPGFLEAMAKHHCTVLMAAYKTVLRDPLPGEEANVHLAARYICGSVVPPGKIFSQNQTAGPYGTDRGYRIGPTYMGATYTETIGGGVCKIASTLYNVAVQADLKIVERHNHGMPVPYVPYGQDATVYYGSKDFRFMNSTAFPVLIWARGVDNILYIGIYGQTTPPEVVWNHDVQRVIPAPVYYKRNAALPPGAEKVAHEGMDGAVIRTWIVRFYADGTSHVEDLGKRYYNPLPWVIESNK